MFSSKGTANSIGNEGTHSSLHRKWRGKFTHQSLHISPALEEVSIKAVKRSQGSGITIESYIIITVK